MNDTRWTSKDRTCPSRSIVQQTGLSVCMQTCIHHERSSLLVALLLLWLLQQLSLFLPLQPNACVTVHAADDRVQGIRAGQGIPNQLGCRALAASQASHICFPQPHHSGRLAGAFHSQVEPSVKSQEGDNSFMWCRRQHVYVVHHNL